MFPILWKWLAHVLSYIHRIIRLFHLRGRKRGLSVCLSACRLPSQ